MDFKFKRPIQKTHPPVSVFDSTMESHLFFNDVIYNIYNIIKKQNIYILLYIIYITSLKNR
jgi:hypothetical protein